MGRDVPDLTAEPPAGPAEPGDHLVEDQQDVIAVAELAQATQVAVRGRHEAAETGHRLDHDRRNRPRPLANDGLLDGVRAGEGAGIAVEAERAAVAIGVERLDQTPTA